MSELWTAIFKDIEYKIVYIDKKTSGNGSYLDVRAIPLFYDQFKVSVIHYLYEGSMTATDCFTRIFSDTDFNFVLVDPAYAVSWEGFGKGQSRMELFKRALDRYCYEFYVEGSTVYLKSLIGNDTNFLYKYRLNASNISQSRDATAMFTHIKGFGNFEEGEEDYLNNAQLRREYTSPLATVMGIREAPPIVDGRVSVTSALDEMMQRAVDDSLQISVEATLHDIRQMGYEEAVPLKGDRVFLMDERIGLDQEIRVQVVETTYNARGEVIKCDVTFGSQNIRQRYKANLQTISKNMRDLLNGKLQLPYDILAPAAKDMLDKIKSVDSELLLDNGIFAVDKENPNNIVGLNSAGWFISTDGGATAEMVATAEGLVANSIKTGDLMTHLVRVVGTEGLFYIDGDTFKAIDPNNDTKYVQITPGLIEISGGGIRIIRPDGAVWMEDGIPNHSLAIQRNEFRHPDVSWTGQNYGTTSAFFLTYENFYAYHDARNLIVAFGVSLRSDASVASDYITVRVREFGNANGNVSGTKRIIAYRDSGTTFDGITLDLGVPTYEPRQFYLEFCFDGDNSAGNTGLVRTNRAVMRG